jgi:hypothetical protein
VSDLTQVQRVETGDPAIAAWRLFGALFFGSVAKLEPHWLPRSVTRRSCSTWTLRSPAPGTWLLPPRQRVHKFRR